MEEGLLRRENKTASKRAAFQKAKELAAAKSAALVEKAQKLRSAAFAAARTGKSQVVKSLVWEDNVAPTDGEFLPAWVEMEKEKDQSKVAKEAEKENEKVKEETSSSGINGAPGRKENQEQKREQGQGQKGTPASPSPVAPGGEGASAPSKSKKKNNKRKGKGGGESTSPPISTPASSTASPHSSVSSPPTSAAPSPPPSTKNNSSRTAPCPAPVTPSSPAPPRKPKHDPRETLLHLAVHSGDAELAEWLVDHGKPLVLFTILFMIRINVRFFLFPGATPDERDSQQFTPFHHSLLHGHVALIRYFISLASPSNPSPPDAAYPLPPGETLLSLAVASANAEAVSLVLEYATVDDVYSNWKWIDDFVAGSLKRANTQRKNGQKTEFDPLVWEAVKYSLVEKAGFAPPAGYGRRKQTSGR